MGRQAKGRKEQKRDTRVAGVSTVAAGNLAPNQEVLGHPFNYGNNKYLELGTPRTHRQIRIWEPRVGVQDS